MGGGIIRISKAEIQKIDGKPIRGDFRMYTSGISTAAATGPVSQATALTQMSDLLQQGAALFGQTVLSSGEKVGAFRRLSEQWRGLDVPEPVRPAHSRGEAAFQMAVDAFGADEAEQKTRADQARAELTSVQDEVKKLAAGRPGGRGSGWRPESAADCVFCKIRDGQIPSTRVYEDERTLCFMDINPLNEGHCLVVTRAHAATLFDAADADLQAAITTARRVARALRAALAPDGLNLLQANGAAAFQSVPHFHLHLIPRWNGDGRGFDWTPVPGDRARIQAAAEKVRAALS